MKSCLDRLGLAASGSHVGIDLLTNEFDKVIEYNLEIGNMYIICPWAGYESKEDYLKAAKLYNAIGEKCHAKGLQFCYHNHAHEFTEYDGQHGLDIIYANSAPEFVQAEIDTYWVKRAGIDPVAYINSYSGRCPLIHLKDMEANEKMDFAELGNGMIDIPAIIDAAKAAGSKWLIVEQDSCKRPPLESIKISYDYLKKIKVI
jgi:sugar phosphate isomerase/epimerase